MFFMLFIEAFTVFTVFPAAFSTVRMKTEGAPEDRRKIKVQIKNLVGGVRKRSYDAAVKPA